MVSVPATYGAILLGGFVAAALSGIVTVQSFIYMKQYPTDLVWRKAIVAAMWILDSAHTGLVFASIWIYLIRNFGDTSKINDIPEYACPITIACSLFEPPRANLHSFFVHRIHKLSCSDWNITAPLLIFAFLRLCECYYSSLRLIHLHTFSEFKRQFRWVFTLGLALSSLVDVLIAAFLCYSLMDYVINSVILYTFESNSLTGAATVVSMVCWLVMPGNLIFMGLHFIISKLYANSLLATLNARKQLRQERAQRGMSGELPLAFPAIQTASTQTIVALCVANTKTIFLEINVEKTVEYDVDVDADSSSHRTHSPSSFSLPTHPSQAVPQKA
ncbi:hypothetical protein K503DRAFT_698315 [Rhizopogon vinicolor AM-OR11-026]|uniref:DUF6534 domain-containing protein n=1 Tax=Rhizopogon vinicolor AM-OR11-026 TaxID=1314800 RepID=A0A1B7MPX7_9AGAM|nr:hypothetical protein K503DRAFT_698315 [Rhizopogon vinicolor AM-OR11-026]